MRSKIKVILIVLSFYFSAPGISQSIFFGVNLDSKIGQFGCSSFDLFTQSLDSIKFGNCILKGEVLNSVDSKLRHFFTEISVMYRTNNPNRAFATIAKTQYSKNDINATKENFYSFNKMLRSSYGTPKSVKEFEDGSAEYQWDNGDFILNLSNDTQKGIFEVIYFRREE
jgi:hypothetical protein